MAAVAVVAAVAVAAAGAAAAVMLWPPGSSWLARLDCPGQRPASRRLPWRRARGADPDWGDIADRMASAVAAGLPIRTAWAHATGGTGRMPPGRDRHGVLAVAGIVAALRLSEQLGIPPVEALRSVASGVRDGRAADGARRAAVAGPAAAARVVAVLPAAGPLLGVLLGVDPLGILFGTGWGRACLVGGIGFLVLAASWSSRLLRRAGAGRW